MQFFTILILSENREGNCVAIYLAVFFSQGKRKTKLAKLKTGEDILILVDFGSCGKDLLIHFIRDKSCDDGLSVRDRH